jgi:hypothetical protein
MSHRFVLRQDEITARVCLCDGGIEASIESLALGLRPFVAVWHEDTTRRDDAMMLRVGAKALRQLADLWEAEAGRREVKG